MLDGLPTAGDYARVSESELQEVLVNGVSCEVLNQSTCVTLLKLTPGYDEGFVEDQIKFGQMAFSVTYPQSSDPDQFCYLHTQMRRVHRHLPHARS